MNNEPSANQLMILDNENAALREIQRQTKEALDSARGENDEIRRMLNNEGRDLSKCLNDRANVEDQLSAAKREIEKLNRQVTLNRENWRMDSEEKETAIRQLKSANESLKNNDGYITDCLGTMSIQREGLSKQLSDLRTENETLKTQWKEYCGKYDLMMARWKDEKADIAKRCGFPWDINGVGLEPWCAADDLRKERDALKSALKVAKVALEELLNHGTPIPNHITGEPEPYQSNPQIALDAMAIIQSALTEE